MKTQMLVRLPVQMKAMARPGKTAWLMASPIMLILRRMRKQPGKAQAMAQRMPVMMIQVSIKVVDSLNGGMVD